MNCKLLSTTISDIENVLTNGHNIQLAFNSKNGTLYISKVLKSEKIEGSVTNDN